MSLNSIPIAQGRVFGLSSNLIIQKLMSESQSLWRYRHFKN